MAPSLYRVILPTDDMAASDRFWSTILGLAVDPVIPTRHYFQTAGAILAVVDPREHGIAPRPNPECVYLRVPDLDATWEQARELDCPAPQGYPGAGIQTRDWGDRSFYSFDPCGNPVCFIDDVRSETRPEAARYAGHSKPNLMQAVLPTESLGRSGAFFEELLGLEVNTFVPNRHFLFCDDCILSLVNPVEHARNHELRPGELRRNPELVYFAVEDLDATYERAQKLRMSELDEGDVGAGIQLRPWGERSFYGRDPSGNPISFVDENTLFTGNR